MDGIIWKKKEYSPADFMNEGLTFTELPPGTRVDLERSPIAGEVRFWIGEAAAVDAAYEVRPYKNPYKACVKVPWDEWKDLCQKPTPLASIVPRLVNAYRASWGRPNEPWPDCLPPMFGPTAPAHPPPKMGLVEIDGEPKLAPQVGEVLQVPADAGEHVWDGVDGKAHAGWTMQHRRQ